MKKVSKIPLIIVLLSAVILGGTLAYEYFQQPLDEKALFISRADRSGTNLLELKIWAQIGVHPSNSTYAWYLEAGASMGTVLRMANEKRAYTLTDRGTWLSFKKQLTNLAVLVENDSTLFNPYGVILVSPERYPQRNFKTAVAFIKFLISEEGQKLIEDFKKGGEALFMPIARNFELAHSLGFSSQEQEVAWYDAQASPATNFPQPLERLRLATTTSTYESGLLDYLTPVFETRYNVKVDIISVGTGQALEIARRGDADLVLVHARELEEAFVRNGYGVHRVGVMYNDFIIIGPISDPAGIRGMTNATGAFMKIAETGAAETNPFLKAMELIISIDPEVLAITFLSLQVSGTAVLLGSIVSILLGAFLGLKSFRGKRPLISFINVLSRSTVNTFMGLPPVVVGLVVYLLLSSSGPLGPLQLLYTPTAMIAAQLIMVIPIITGVTMAAVGGVDKAIWERALSLGATEWQTALTVLREARMGLLTAIVAAFGAAISEVGGIMIVGGNIRWSTRVLTTAIVYETELGNFEVAMALGIVLLALAFVVNLALTYLQVKGVKR